ncbi:peptidase inhibitor family I36 protein [Allokutzneria sp. A3M-2-11 16]|uniref:peptidase inhibitor family I36 protein n=1 Tax=Allokutzneria sp. A3M-2-11 16 TaxID=2962043 RepID=UPI0020B79600|nr:peptidase inhibitor family I36 protein [Allokutzneria sp. A3M-2-11 16]MCP3803044.1 peptidase inhibitor family I36 protein [Allokutzneria sp. A3M-2-11 16]
MKSRVLSAVAVSALATAGLLSAAAPATAAPLKCATGYFCAYEHINFTGAVLIQSRAGRGARVDAPDNRTSSGSNNTGNQWVGVNIRLGIHDDVYKWAPYTDASTIPGANDKIDFFDVK